MPPVDLQKVARLATALAHDTDTVFVVFPLKELFLGVPDSAPSAPPAPAGMTGGSLFSTLSWLQPKPKPKPVTASPTPDAIDGVGVVAQRSVTQTPLPVDAPFSLVFTGVPQAALGHVGVASWRAYVRAGEGLPTFWELELDATSARPSGRGLVTYAPVDDKQLFKPAEAA